MRAEYKYIPFVYSRNLLPARTEAYAFAVTSAALLVLFAIIFSA
jgi:hypothetical protein